MVDVLTIFQVDVQTVTVTLLGLGMKDRCKITGEPGQRQTWRLHKAKSLRLRNNTLRSSNSQQNGDRPGDRRPGTICW